MGYLPIPMRRSASKLKPVSGFFDGWGDLMDVVTGKETTRAEDLDNQIIAVNNQKVAAGQLSQAQADAATQALLADDPESYRTAVGSAFLQGAGDGLAAEQEWTKRALTTIATTATGSILGFIPWWIWLAGAGYGAYRLGLFEGIIGNIKGRLAKTSHDNP